MNRDFQQEQDDFYDSIGTNQQSSAQNYPPRGTIHRTKKEKTKSFSGQVILGSFIFIIILTVSIYFLLLFNGNNSNSDFDTLPVSDINENNSEGNNENNSDTTNSDAEDNINDNESSTGNEDQTNSEDQSNSEDQTNSNEQQANNEEETESDINSDELQTDERVHEVQSGENLFRISLLYYGTGEYAEELAKYNGLADSNDLYVGYKLIIPNEEFISENQ